MQIKVEEKINILKSFRSELFVNTKKGLQLAKNRLLELFEKLHFHIWYTKEVSREELMELLDEVEKI